MPLLVRVFTHPACKGCGPVVKMCWELSKLYPQIELKTVSLERKDGLSQAQAEHIRTIPSVIISQDKQELRRFTGTPDPDELGSTVAHLVMQDA